MSGTPLPPAGRQLVPGTHPFDDVDIGDWLETRALEIRADHIDRFAELSGDFFEIHMSEDGAKRHGFPTRVAHGLLVLALVDGLKNQADVLFRAVASLSWDWTFHKPVFPGDIIRARLTVEDKRQTRRPDRGILTLRFDVKNQKGETVQSGVNRLMVWR
jgi:acyl dehydratase